MLNNFDDYIGQEEIKENLNVFINSAKIQKKCLDHIFIYAQSGMGKSTLAKLIANKMKKKIHIYYANNFRKASDLFSCFSKIKRDEVLFIDEIHRLNKELEEFIFPVLESFNLSITMGKDYSSKVVNIKLENFTIICATTELHKINEQFINRFPIFFAFKKYSFQNIKQIINNLFTNKNIKINDDALNLFAFNTKYNPRIANNLVKRVFDYCLVDKVTIINESNLKNIFYKINIFENGINNIDLHYLAVIENGPFSIKTIQQLTNYPINMIINNIEPNLLQNYYIKKTTKGRQITKKGKELLKKLK